MAPKAKITKEQIICAGLELVRKEGEEGMNVRAVAAVLGCSTQPIMSHYATVKELQSDIYDRADAFHSEYLMEIPEDSDPMLSIGMNYIRFAVEEKHLFRFLFQSDKFKTGVGELLASEALAPIIEPLAQGAQLSETQAREVFETLFICAHGIASLLANNSMEFDEKYCERVLTNAFMGAVGYMKGGNL